MKLNLFREFQKDLNIVVSNEIMKTGSKNGIGRLIGFSALACAYILSKPFYNYYRGRLERKHKIKQLKIKGEFIMD
jgi:arginine/ornithine N-succinyltransferase beta subunit